ncbi:MAG: glycosyltransferase family 39 protein [Caldilineaceae bacterium]
MRTLVAEWGYSATLRIVSIALLAALVILLIVTTEQDKVEVGATLFLYGLAPGLLLTGWWFPKQNILERLVLSVGSSFALSTLTLLLMALVWGPLTMPKVVVSLAGLLALLIVLPFLLRRNTDLAVGVPAQIWLNFLLVIVVAGALRLPWLGESELQDDEIDVGNAVHQVIRGDTQALFRDRRGPAQTLITSAFYLVTDKPEEWVLRTPVAVTNLAAIAALFVLAWTLFNWQIAFVSGLLLSLDGFVLAYGRVVQMQSTLLLMMVLATLCFYLAYRTAKQAVSVRYIALGILLFAFGLLAHYEMILMAPVLGYLYFATRSRAGRPINIKWLVIGAVTLLLVVGGFYAPFVLNPAFHATYAYYTQEIVGRGLRDNLYEFMLVGTFYNSIYYFATLWLLLGLTWTIHLSSRIGDRLWERWVAIALGVVAFLILSADLFNLWRQPLLSLVAGTTVAVFCIGVKRTSVEMRVLFLWFFGFFILYSFRLRELHVHYYVYSMPWAVLAALSLAWLYQQGLKFVKRFRPRREMGYFISVAIGAELFLLLCAGYIWLAFLQPAPEYALTYPQFKKAPYFTLYDKPQGEAFGFPHQSGWKTIGYLYRTGVLRGNYETNELYLTATWYTRDFIRDDAPPRYYFVATVPHRLQAAPWPRPFDPNAYHLIGTVTVNNQPRLQMYERNSFPDNGIVRLYPAEMYDPLYNRMVTAADVQQEERFQADDQFFRAVAQHLMSTAESKDGLLLYTAQQAGILSYYYQGHQPYYLPTAHVATDVMEKERLLRRIIGRQHPHLYALFWGEQAQDPTGQFEIWLNEQLFKLDEQWFGNLRLVRYDVPEKAPTKTVAHPLPMVLGAQIRFAGYDLSQKDNLHLALFWQALKPVDKRYKVFVHLLDKDHKIVGQNDSEPGGGRQPTDRWQVAAPLILDNYALALPPDLAKGEYTVEIGMYNPATGARLSVLNAQQVRQPDDAIRFTIEIKAR